MSMESRDEFNFRREISCSRKTNQRSMRSQSSGMEDSLKGKREEKSNEERQLIWLKIKIIKHS